MIVVTIRTILDFKKILGSETTLELPDSSTLEDLLKLMADKWGDAFRDPILQPGTHSPRNRIRLLVNGRDIAFLNGLETRLATTDEVLIMPPIAGG